jgi:DNA polymerase-3 subunit beta
MKNLTLTINTTEILSPVAYATRFMSKDGNFAGLLKISSKRGSMCIEATNLIETIAFKEISYVNVSDNLTQSEFPTFSIDGKKLLTVLKAAKSETISLELLPEMVIIKSGRSKIKISKTAETQEIEIIKSGDTFDFTKILSQIEKVLHSVDSNNPRAELNGVHLYLQKGVLDIVSSDTRRLALVSTEVVSKSLKNLETILPKNGAKTIIELFDGFRTSVNIDENTLSVHTPHVSYSTKLINGKFPEYQRILPKVIDQRVLISSHGFNSLVKEASLFNDEIIISIKNGSISVSSLDGEVEVIDELANTENTDILFSINAKYILDFISSLSKDEDEVEIGFNKTNLPIVLAVGSQREILMPIVMQEGE